MKDQLVVPLSSPGEEKDDLSSVAPLDFARCVAMLGGDRELVLSLLKEFLTNLDKQITTISGALRAGHRDVVCKVAHSIKGSAAVLSAHPLMAAAGVLENIGKSDDLGKGEAVLLRLEREAALLVSYSDELTGKPD